MSIPVELIDLIFESLLVNTITDHPVDLSSLKVCAIVCRAWLPSARRLLFRTMTFRANTNLYGLLDLLLSSPGIAACLRQLTIFISLGDASNPWLMSVGPICARLTNVERFQLRYFPFPYFDGEALQSFFLSLQPIMCSARSLSLQAVAFENVDQLLRFLRAFPHVTELDLVNTGFPATAHPIKPRHSFESFMSHEHHPKLRSLRITHCRSNVVRSLWHAASILSLRHLVLHMTFFDDTERLTEAAALRFIGSLDAIDCLESFNFEQALPSGIHALCQLPNKMPELKLFTAHVAVFPDRRRTLETVGWLDGMLSNLPSTIQHIIIRFRGHETGVDGLDWSLIDSAIEARNLTSLECVVIEFSTRMSQGGMQRLQSRLAELELSRRGLLRIVV